MLTIPLYDDNPTVRTPVVTIAFIAANVLVFLWQLGWTPREEVAYSLTLGFVPALFFGSKSLPPEVVLLPSWATIFTSMFLHGGLMHIAGNMLFLWIFGNNVEDAVGRVRYVFFYLACGIAAALAQAFVDPASSVPMVGASGAIGGVLGAYIVLHPRANVRVFVWIIFFIRLINVPAALLLGVWFGMQIFGVLTPGDGGIAFAAHVGGFLAGVGLVFLLHRPSVPVLQPARTQPFAVQPPGALRDRAGFRSGSVPEAGRAPRPDPWGRDRWR
jgi:membrane associated rhomboid family serine protease